MMPNTDRFRPPSAHDEIARCASCGERFHYTQLDECGFCPTCQPQLNENEIEMIMPRPRIVCLCGSTRFWREFQRASLRETLQGRIVLSIGAAGGTDDEHFGNLSKEEYERVKVMLDELHKRKIDLADEVLILNVGGYIGNSTRSELEYAQAHNKRIRYLENPNPTEKAKDT